MKNKQSSYYFPQNYDHSRQRFLGTVQKIAIPCQVGTWKVPSPTDDTFFVDHVYLPALKSPKNLIVLISGIHGSETYAGSAVLQLFLEEILPETCRDHLGFFIVHAMNPYGFKNHRRCTENKVNLNRNFSVSGDLFSTKAPVSNELNEMFITRKPVGSLRSRLLDSMQIKDGKVYFADVLSDDLIKGVSPGQFERPDNLEYGGQKTEPQTDALIGMMRKLMPEYENILALDLHTGLGDQGRLHLLTDGEKDSLDPELFKKVFHPEEDKKFYEFTPPETEGFYSVHGATNSMFAGLRLPNQKVCAVTLEFGTLGHSPEQQLADFNVSLLDHEGYHYGFSSPSLESVIRAQQFEKSYPNNDLWRSSVLTAAEGLLSRMIARLQI